MHELNARWGIVTNKPTDLTNSLFERLAMSQPPECIVCGDTLATRKPDPATLLHAAKLVDSVPERSIYVGDSSIDIRAGRAAGMTTIAAAYGYIHPSDDIDAWGADAIIRHPSELVPLLKQLWK